MSTSTGTTGQGGQGAGGTQGTGTTGQGQSRTTSKPFMPTKPIMGDGNHIPPHGPKGTGSKGSGASPEWLVVNRAKRKWASVWRPIATNSMSLEASTTNPIIKFQRDTLRHFKTYGLDTITYIPLNDSTKTEMVTINMSDCCKGISRGSQSERRMSHLEDFLDRSGALPPPLICCAFVSCLTIRPASAFA